MKIPALGIDAAFSNMGFARVVLDVRGADINIDVQSLTLCTTAVIEDRKVTRKSSTELRRARELHEALDAAMSGVQLAFAEVPSGSQSANAARALGIAVGVLARVPAGQMIEVSPHDVKEVVLGTRKQGKMPSKAEMIAWAMKLWPDAPWRLHTRAIAPRRISSGANKGKKTRGIAAGAPLAENEHLADALGAVAAGIRSPDFLRLLPMLAQQARLDQPWTREQARRRIAL